MFLGIWREIKEALLGLVYTCIIAMKNSVTLNKDGIVEIMTHGPQTADSVNEMGSKARYLLEELGKQGKPQLILDDITHLGVTDIPARKAVANLAHTLPFQRVAMLGDGSVFMRISTNLLLHGIGKGNLIHYFENRDKAIAWLRSAPAK
jgi:glutaredoxin